MVYLRKLKGKFPRLYAIVRLIFERDSYLYKSGWFESIRRGYPCQADGAEVPWMNYAIISFLEKRLTKSMVLFEYGSGYSTMFYSNLVKKVVSVEHNQDWYKKINNKLLENVALLFRNASENGNYSKAVSELKIKFDVIVIDGYDRVNCMKYAIDAVHDSGVIILVIHQDLPIKSVSNTQRTMVLNHWNLRG